jgi:hypothetical protein
MHVTGVAELHNMLISTRTSVLFEAGLFESKIRIRYACVHLGGFTKEISSSH